MDSAELIMLGAFAQNNFNMEPDFKVQYLDSDHISSVVRIAHARSGLAMFTEERNPSSSEPTTVDYEEVELQYWPVRHSKHLAGIGYSHRANILFVKEVR